MGCASRIEKGFSNPSCELSSMKQLFQNAEFEAADSRTPLPMECYQCHNTFYAAKHYIQKVLAHGASRVTNQFCSRRCRDQYRTVQRLKLNCAQCNKLIFRRPRQVAAKHVFCSRSCSATYNNLHKTTGTRSSKLERWLQYQLPSRYPSLGFSFNDKDAIHSELDIYIPSLSLAFELNGIYHYEPIHGVTKLSKVQCNDQRKFQACLENSIDLCVIDTSKLSYFKEHNAQKYMDIICDIIDRKLAVSQPA